jgi:hypothetical protein
VTTLDYLWLEVDVVGAGEGLELLRNAAITSVPTRERLRIEVGAAPEGWSVLLDRRRHPARDLHHVAETGYAAVHDRVARWAREEGWMRLHAALVDVGRGAGRRRVAIAGPSGVGKTTTVLALAGPGATVLGDEAVLVRDGLSIALPRPLHAKHAGARIAGLRPSMVLARLDYDDPIAVLDPAAVNRVPRVRHETAPIDLVVLLDRGADPLAVQRVGAGEAVLALAPDAGPFTPDRGALVRAVVALADATPVVRLGMGTPAQTAEAIRGLV